MAPKQAYLDGLLDDSSLPTVLCLHGSGTNSSIFNLQSVRIQRALKDTFHFIFLDGPIVTGPGPDVLPIFEGCEPFLRWTGPDIGPIPDETIRIIKNAIKERQKKAPVVAVMGFSQGARLAAGLLFEQQLREREGGEGLGAEFKFGVFCNGTSPPLTDKISEPKELISVPSVHVVGLTDPWRKSSEDLYENYFDKKTATKVELDVGHRFPMLPEQNEKIVSEIRRLYKETVDS